MRKNFDNAEVIDFRVRVPPGLCPPVDVPATHSSQYNAVLNTGEKYAAAQTLDDLLQGMDHSRVDHAVIHAEHEVGDVADALNRTVADIVDKHPDRFTGIGTISLDGFSIKKALRQVDECAEMGLIGLSIEPAFFGRGWWQSRRRYSERIRQLYKRL